MHFTYRYELMMDCWHSDPQKRPSFSTISSKVDRIMELSAGYLDLAAMSEEREGTIMDISSDTESPDLPVSQLIKGIKTEAGITIRLNA